MDDSFQHLCLIDTQVKLETDMNIKGFTLIELVITVGILAILAAVAIPSYQDYMIRARVTDGLHRAIQAKHAVADYQFTNNALPSDQSQTFYETSAPSEYVESIVIGNEGIITITYTIIAGGGTIVLTPFIQANGDISWDCKTGTLAPKYRPTICRP